MKRQQQHGAGVVRVEPRTLAFGRAKGEELLEEFFVDHDAADQRRQHAHGQRTDHINPEHAGHEQGEVEQEKEAPARRLAYRQDFTSVGVQGHRYAVATPAGRGAQLGRAIIGQAYAPLFGVGLMLAQVAQATLHGLFVRQMMGGQLRVHPVVDLLIEHRQAAGQKNRKQQPAYDQSTPGVQPGQRLGDGLFHPSRSSSCGQKPIAANGSASTAPIQADH